MNSYTFYRLPEEPENFKGKFFMTYFDDDGNLTASTPFSQSIELATTLSEDGKTMILSGTASRNTHQAFQIPVDNHAHGVRFSIISRNRHKMIADQLFWRRYMNSRQVSDLFREEITPDTLVIAGDLMQVPDHPQIDAKLYLRNIRGHGHIIDKVHVAFPVELYHLFYDRIKD